MYYWDGEIDDEGARESLIAYHGADADELDELTLPSEMNARRPEWMVKENAAPSAQLPPGLRRKLKRFHAAHKTVTTFRPECRAWDLDLQVAYDYIPGIEECSSLPPLTLVPFDQVARELDDVARNGMEMGFMEVAGLCPLRHANHIDDWLSRIHI